MRAALNLIKEKKSKRNEENVSLVENSLEMDEIEQVLSPPQNSQTEPNSMEDFLNLFEIYLKLRNILYLS